jgi:hypothetical protein
MSWMPWLVRKMKTHPLFFAVSCQSVITQSSQIYPRYRKYAWKINWKKPDWSVTLKWVFDIEKQRLMHFLWYIQRCADGCFCSWTKIVRLSEFGSTAS